MRRMSRPWQVGVALVAVTLAMGACSSDGEEAALVEEERSVTVMPNRLVNETVVNVSFTADGFDPEIVFVPAGHPVRLVLRNRTEMEHHYRVRGLLASDVRYFVFPDIDSTEIDGLTVEELAAIDPALAFVTDEAEIEHILHHLIPYQVMSRDESRSGIKPIPGEVHGYAHRGEFDTLNFIPLTTGRFVVEDVRFPEITGTMVVYLPPDAVIAAG